MILTLSSLLMMFSNLMQQTKKIIQDKYFKNECVNNYVPSDVAISKESIDDKSHDIKYQIYDLIRTIRDPEKPATLEDLNVVYEEGVQVNRNPDLQLCSIKIEFNPTVPHCSLATLIGLCIRIKLLKSMVENVKLDIYIKEGAHTTEEEINKQINDKERVAAAMENPSLREVVEKCIKEEE